MRDPAICNFTLFPVVHHILPYFFANIPFKICSMGSVLTTNDGETHKLFVYF
jgi:hypothetical protein